MYVNEFKKANLMREEKLLIFYVVITVMNLKLKI